MTVNVRDGAEASLGMGSTDMVSSEGCVHRTCVVSVLQVRRLPNKSLDETPRTQS